MKHTRGLLLTALALTACGGDSPTSIASKTTTSAGLPSGSGSQGNQNPVPIEGKGICAGKETFKSPAGDVTYCVLSTDLQIQENLCHFIKPEDPPTLRHKVGVITGPTGAYIKKPLGYSAPENDCGAVKTENGGTGLILLEEADASGGAEIPPNSEKALTFAFTRDAAACGRVQSVADLLTASGASLKIAGWVLNYPKACQEECSTLFAGNGYVADDEITPESRGAQRLRAAMRLRATRLHSVFVPSYGIKEFLPEFTVPAGWTVTIDASLTETTSVRATGKGFPILAAAISCGNDGIDASSSDGTLHFVNPFPQALTCSVFIASVDPESTSYSVRKCPGLQPQDRDEGPLFD